MYDRRRIPDIGVWLAKRLGPLAHFEAGEAVILGSAEPEAVTEEERAELDMPPEEQHEYQPPDWVRELAEARKTFSEKIAERQSVMEPDEDPDYEDIGQAFPSWQQNDREAVLQPPKPPIPPSERLAERESEAGGRGL